MSVQIGFEPFMDVLFGRARLEGLPPDAKLLHMEVSLGDRSLSLCMEHRTFPRTHDGAEQMSWSPELVAVSEQSSKPLVPRLSKALCMRCIEEAFGSWSLRDESEWNEYQQVMCPRNGSSTTRKELRLDAGAPADCPFVLEHRLVEDIGDKSDAE